MYEELGKAIGRLVAVMVPLAIIGAVTLFTGVGYGLYWLFKNVSIVLV